jgi:hypothetical protein
LVTIWRDKNALRAYTAASTPIRDNDPAAEISVEQFEIFE